MLILFPLKDSVTVNEKGKENEEKAFVVFCVNESKSV